MQVDKVIEKVRNRLFDTIENNYRYSDTVMLDAYNEALIWIKQQQQDLFSEDVEFLCGEGNRQDNPENTDRFLKVISNTNSQEAIESITRHHLTRLYEDWMKHKGREVELFFVDDNDSDHFYIYPSVKKGHKLTVRVLSNTPEQKKTDNVPLTLQYLPVLINYMSYSVYSIDANDSANAAQAENYLKNAMYYIDMIIQTNSIYDNKRIRKTRS